MSELVGRKTVNDVAQRTQHGKHSLGNPRLILGRFYANGKPFVPCRYIHAGERCVSHVDTPEFIRLDHYLRL